MQALRNRLLHIRNFFLNDRNNTLIRGELLEELGKEKIWKILNYEKR